MPHKGSKWSEEAKKHHKGMLGKHFSSQTRKQMSETRKNKFANGFSYSLNTLRNMSDSKKGKNMGNTFRKGLPGPYKGQHQPKARPENHWNWKGGITPKNMIIRRSIEIKVWRQKVFERDDFRCFDCGQKGGNLEAHHIYPFSSYPRIRMEIENGITLCKSCHKNTQRSQIDTLKL